MKKILIHCSYLLIVVSSLLLNNSLLAVSPALEIGKGSFMFNDWAGPAIKIWYYVPEKIDAESNVLIVMHGAKRDADRYRDQWIEAAEQSNCILVVPEFSKEAFPKSRLYNLGGVNDKKGNPLNSKYWTFSVIEPLFDEVIGRTRSEQNKYIMYGHSAGSQFVHRYNYFMPEARMKRAIAANAGWYTLANNTQKYPYGIEQTGLNKENLQKAFARELIILLGDKDINTQDKNLRKTEEAMQQGQHRFARGKLFFAYSSKVAKKMQTEFNWQLAVVHDADHDNAKMIQAAIPFLIQD